MISFLQAVVKPNASLYTGRVSVNMANISEFQIEIQSNDDTIKTFLILFVTGSEESNLICGQSPYVVFFKTNSGPSTQCQSETYWPNIEFCIKPFTQFT